MTSDDAIVIVGVGARTPLGFDAASSAAAVRAGISAIQQHPTMIDRFGKQMKVTRDTGIDIHLQGPDRAVAIAVDPAMQALRPILGAISSPPVSLIVVWEVTP